MKNFLGDPYQNLNAIDYKLSIPPLRVMEIVKEQTEFLTSVQRVLPFSTKSNTQYWSRCSGNDVFKILKKWNVKGYSNSFSPWLVGQVKNDKSGSSVKISFEMDKRVSIFSQIYFYMLIFLTVIMGSLLVRSIFSNILTTETIIGVVVIFVFWVFLYGFRKVGFHLGQQERTAMIEFIENLFANYKVS